MVEASSGRALALLALAPIAARLADQQAHEEAKAERRRRLDDELEALPSLERPTRPPEPEDPWWVSLRLKRDKGATSHTGGILILLICAWVVMYALMLILGPKIAAVLAILVGLCGAAFVIAWIKRDILDVIRCRREAVEAHRSYSLAIKAYDAREAERAAIKEKIEALL